MTTAPQLDLAAVKARQQAARASGDFAEIATLIGEPSERTFTVCLTSTKAFVDCFAAYGPTVKALEAAGSRRYALERDFEALALSWSRLKQPGPIAIPAAYLESFGMRR